MKFFDRINFIGRVLVGGYITYLGINGFLNPSLEFSPIFVEKFLYFLAFWKVIGGLALATGIKPRATAAILIIVFLLNIIVDSFNLPSFSIYPFLEILINKVETIGALLFIAGTRMIPYGLMIRSEESMNDKYGGK